MPPAPSLSTYIRNGLFGGIVAGLLNLLLLLLARLLQITIDLPMGPNAVTTAPLTWWAVVGLSVAAGLVAALILWALRRLTEHGWEIGRASCRERV